MAALGCDIDDLDKGFCTTRFARGHRGHRGYTEEVQKLKRGMRERVCREKTSQLFPSIPWIPPAFLSSCLSVRIRIFSFFLSCSAFSLCLCVSSEAGGGIPLGLEGTGGIGV